MIARVNSLVFTTLLGLATGGLALPSSRPAAGLK
jgi:hypothetical protein